MFRSVCFLPLLVSCLSVFMAPILAGDGGEPSPHWARFRGPNGTGLAPGKGIPSQWSDDDVNWKVKLPGVGHAQPVIWGHRIFMRAANEDGTKRVLFCMSVKDGSTEWTREYDAVADAKHELNSYASSTPALDAERVYIVYGTSAAGWIRAYTHTGEDVWKVDLGPFKTVHGHGSSPIVFRDMVIVAKDVKADSFLTALDRKTGEKRWRIPRENELVAYSTPCVYEPSTGNPQLFFNSRARGITAVDALVGTVIWEAKVLERRSVSSPVIGAGVLIGTTGSGGGGNYLAAVKLGGQGDVTETHLAYKITQAAPYVPTPVIRGDRIFMWNRMGIVSCAKVANGEVVWRERVGGEYYGSPVCLDERLFCVSNAGEVVVVAATDEFKLLGRTDLGEACNSTPAVAGGRLYVRTAEHLISVGGKELP